MRIFNKSKNDQDFLFSSTLKGIIGKRPKNLELYKISFRHTSVKGDSNERLEYLGDAILGSVVAEFLFKKFPFKDEGFLTEIRSRIVKRESLNRIAMRMGIHNLIDYDKKSVSRTGSLYGNALEAFIGAIYLDRGYEFTKKYIVGNMIYHYIDMDDLVNNNTNYKSTILEWAQKQQKKISFTISQVDEGKNKKMFTAELLLDNELIAEGCNNNKKKAEQAAAKKAITVLGIQD